MTKQCITQFVNSHTVPENTYIQVCQHTNIETIYKCIMTHRHTNIYKYTQTQNHTETQTWNPYFIHKPTERLTSASFMKI